MRGASPSRSPAEGSLMRGASPSRSPAEGSALSGLQPLALPAGFLARRRVQDAAGLIDEHRLHAAVHIHADAVAGAFGTFASRLRRFGAVYDVPAVALANDGGGIAQGDGRSWKRRSDGARVRR